jgi:hypothetical protein
MIAMLTSVELRARLPWCARSPLVLGRAARGLAILSSLALVAAAPVGAQSLASRVAQAPDGVVRMQFESRMGVCGDGRDMVGFRNAMWARNFQTFGRWSSRNCVPGPLRVTLIVADGEVQQVRTQVGGSWPGAEGRVTDLGVVPSRDASAYFFTLVPRLETAVGKDRILLPAVLADEGVVVPSLIGLARDRSRASETRKQAMLWLGMLGDDSGRRALRAIIEDGDEPNKFRTHAIFSLAHGGDTPDAEFLWLRDLYARVSSEELKEAVIHGMSQDEERGSRWLIERARDGRETSKLRQSALFWAGQSEATRTADLVGFYDDTREDKLREHAIFVLSQRKDDAAIDALIRIVQKDSDTRMRGKALFWLAQKNDPRVTKIISDLVLK